MKFLMFTVYGAQPLWSGLFYYYILVLFSCPWKFSSSAMARSILYSSIEFRAKRLEKLLDTPARIYYKYEGNSPAGSHKPNTAIPQVWYNAQQGIKNVVTETGAGQWGSSLAFACSLFGLGCEVRNTFIQKSWPISINFKKGWIQIGLLMWLACSTGLNCHEHII